MADYIYAAFRHASTPEEMVRWDMMSQLIEDITSSPLEMTYNASKRLASEGIVVAPEKGSNVVFVATKHQWINVYCHFSSIAANNSVLVASPFILQLMDQ